MFVSVARLTLQIPDSGSLKAKRHILRRVTDRVKAKFNVSIAEVDDQDVWQKATVGLAVVGNDRRHVTEQVDKIIHFVEEMYVAPLLSRQTETFALGEQLFDPADSDLPIALGQRSLAEAEGLGDWNERHRAKETKPGRGPGGAAKLSLDEARARARSLRNPRDWEKE